MDLYTWIIVICLILATLIALFLFIKTPKSERTQKFALDSRRTYLEKKLSSYPESAQAVLLKGNSKKAMVRLLPFIFIFVPPILFVIYATRIVNDPLCDFTFGINTALLAIGLFILALYLVLLIVSGFVMRSAYKTIKTGYFPPLDSVQFADRIATRTVYSKLIGYFFILFFPLVVLFTTWTSYSAVMVLTDNDPLHYFQKKNAVICDKSSKSLGVTYE